ncbi:hypothetical protein FACS1894184_05730 [Clostridia bacterium]|nr:hypothetical protein FACS1894184_05730 [Clostridia bacterium]
MSIRVAIATSDGKVVNQHFGRCSVWTVLDVFEDGSFEFIERRDIASVCAVGGHSDEALKDAVSCLSDCRAVVVSRIGPGAAAMLESHGIAAFEFGGFIDDAVRHCAAEYSSDLIDSKTNSERVNVI